VAEDLTGSQSVRHRVAASSESAGPRLRPGETLERGATIGRYVVLNLVGRGGMGDVYGAYDPELDRKVAVKLVRTRADGRGGTGDGRSRLLREAQAIAKLSHPNVVVAYDVGTYDDSVFIAMEYVDGQTVGYWQQAGTRTWQEVLAVYRAAGLGLAAAHQAGMVHRDFKPDNVMVTPEGAVRVMDFGLARHASDGADLDGARAASWATRTKAAAAAGFDPESTLPLGRPGERQPAMLSSSSSSLLDSKITRTGAMLGTPAYMAPEQFAGKAADARSDQFSFCVALYEGLYGRRPFAGNHFQALMASVLGGEIAEPPADAKVPAWIRRILLRGLSTKPEARYPSMTALLSALAQDPAQAMRRRLGGAVATVGVAAAVVAAGVAWRASRPGAAYCAAGAGKLAGIWELAGAGPSARKLAIHRAFTATGKSYAENAFGSASQILDRYVSGWTAMYTDTCEATQVRGEQSPDVMDLRMSCLGERLGRVKALTDVFAAASATVVENAVAAAGGLPPLDRCADTRLLRAIMPPPDDPAARAKLEDLRRELAHVKALGDSGQCAAGLAAGGKLVGEAKTLGYLPFQAETLNAEGDFGSGCSDPAAAIELHKEALWAAEASHHDEAAVSALLSASHLAAGMMDDVTGPRDWVQLAGAILHRMSQPPAALEAWRLTSLGIIANRQHRAEEALGYFKGALALQEKTFGANSLDVAKSLNNVGTAYQGMGRLDESLASFHRAAEMMSSILGAEHPVVAITINNEGEVLNALHRYDEAQPLIGRAVEIWRKSGSAPFYLASELTTLGETLLGLGREAEAQARLEEALRLFDSTQASHPATRFALARALWPVPAQRPRALALAKLAKADYDKSASSPARAGEVASWIERHATP
jgi:serine/threonine protein kinase/tetratricopeptide (TPR) repeat protein